MPQSSIVEYAIHNGIACDHRDEIRLKNLIDELQKSDWQFQKVDFHDEHHIRSLCRQGRAYIERRLNERLPVTREILQRLANLGDRNHSCTPEFIESAMLQDLPRPPSSYSLLEEKSRNTAVVSIQTKLSILELPPVKVGVVRNLSNTRSAIDLVLEDAKTYFLPDHGDRLAWPSFCFPHGQDLLAEQMNCNSKIPEHKQKPRPVVQSHQLLWSPPLEDVLDPEDMIINVEDIDDVDSATDLEESMSDILLTDSTTSILEKSGFSQHNGPAAVSQGPVSKPSPRQQGIHLSQRTPVTVRPAAAFDLQHNLSSFLSLRGRKFKQEPKVNIDSTGSPTDPIEWTQQDPTEGIESHRALEATPSKQAGIQASSMPTLSSVSRPCIRPLCANKTIILKTSLLNTNVQLCLFLERNGGKQLSIIYRDADKSSPGPVTSSQQPMPDVILNTTSCILFSNSYALDQRSLPGQDSVGLHSPLAGRMTNLAQLYDNIFVVFQCPHITDIISNQQADRVAALKDKFAAICAGLKKHQDVAIHSSWVTISNESSNVHGDSTHDEIWSLIYRYGLDTEQNTAGADTEQSFSRREAGHRLRVPSGTSEKKASPGVSITLSQEQTFWEEYLCRAGLNPMSAQVVIQHLKHYHLREGMQDGDPSSSIRHLIQLDRPHTEGSLHRLIGGRAIERLLQL